MHSRALSRISKPTMLLRTSKPLNNLLRRLCRSLSAVATASPHPHHPPPPPPQENPYELMKNNAIDTLSDLWVRSFSHPSSYFPNLSGFLKDFDLWVLAYQRSCAHYTGSFPPAAAIHLPHLRSLLSLRLSVVSRPPSFIWGSATHLLLRSPTDPPSTRPISRRKLDALLSSAPPPFQDRVVQELLLLLLEPLFEPKFSSKSHAFRPGRNAHTLLRTIRSNFAGYVWFLKADLRHVTGNLSPDVISGCLEKVVKDKKVLGLIKSALKTPVRVGTRDADKVFDKLTKKRLKRKVLRMSRKKKILKDNEPKPDPYWLRTFFDFAPEEAANVPSYAHCGILSPLLANVCLNELDHWLEEKIDRYFCPSKLDSIWRESSEDGCHNPAWPEFVPSSGNEKTRRMDFVRYGSHVLIGIRGPREDAVEIRKEIMDFCEDKFGIRLENSKIEIEHITRGIEFLDHVICRRVIHPTLRYTATGGKIVSEKGVGTLLSVTASMQRCMRQFRKLELLKGDKDPEPLPCTPMLYSGQAHTNAQMNKFLETMADWYRYADNRKKVVGFCAYVMRSSLAKLYAARYRLKSRAKVYKVASRDLSRPLNEATRNDAPEYSDLLRMGLVDTIDGVRFSHMSLIPSCDYTPFPRNWIPHHEMVLQEYIKLQDPKFFYQLYKSVKRLDLNPPQEDISKTVWDYKVRGVRGSKSLENIKQTGSPVEVDSNNELL